MYNKQIYDLWELHQDATQLEINYKYFVKIIEILNVKSLLQCSSNGDEIEINDKNIIHQWQEKKLLESSEQFSKLSELDFPNNVWFSNSKDIFISSLFKAGFILNMLKVTNYKAQQSEAYYEPTLFKIASEILSIEHFEEWITSLTNTILYAEEIIDKKIISKWDICLNKRGNNTFWYLENLFLSFNDIYTWYQKNMSVLEDNPNIEFKKDIIVNSINHWIIYSLVDFYVKYIFDQNFYEDKKISFQKVHDVVLGQINKMIKDKTFAMISFKSIAKFLNVLLTGSKIKSDDRTIDSFIKIISITSSEKNKQNLLSILFGNDKKLMEENKINSILNDSSELYLYEKDKNNRES